MAVTIDKFEYATDALVRAAWSTALSESCTFRDRVLADGGIMVSFDVVDAAITHAKDNNYYSAISGWYSTQFAYKDAGSGLVSKWYDLSPNKNDLIGASGTQPVYTANQQNGLAGIVTTGNKKLSLAAPLQTTTSYSMFLCFKLNGTSGTQVIISNGFLGENGYGFFIANSKSQIIHGSLASLTNGSATTDFKLWEGIHATDDRRFYIDAGEPTADEGNPKTPTTNFLFGVDNSSNFAPGVYGEFMMLNTAVSTAQRQAIETLLNARWAIYS